MKSRKRLLFIRVSEDYSPETIHHIGSVCHLIDVDFCVHEFKNLEIFEQEMDTGEQYDFVYVASHGCDLWFSERDKSKKTFWSDFGSALCESDVLKRGATVFLGCCQGGMKKVAQILFYNCPSIVSVCGPKGATTKYDVALAIHAFLFNLVLKREQHEQSAKRASRATGQSFVHYHRSDFEADMILFKAHPNFLPEGFQASYRGYEDYDGFDDDSSDDSWSDDSDSESSDDGSWSDDVGRGIRRSENPQV